MCCCINAEDTFLPNVKKYMCKRALVHEGDELSSISLIWSPSGAKIM